MEAHYIYSLLDPRDNRVRYVGQTKNPKLRNCSHRCPDIRGRQNKKWHWIVELRELGLRPIFKIIEECTEETFQERERFWIAHYGGIRNLLNARIGGQLPAPSMPEVYAAIGAKLRGRKRPEVSPKLVDAWKYRKASGYEVTDETKAKIRQANHVQFLDPETRENHRVGMKKWASENRAVCSKGGKAAAQTPNFVGARQKFWSEMTPEQRENFCKRRAALQGPPVITPEFIASCKQAQKSAWADESVRNARIAGIKAAWADPVKRAARIEKNRLTRTN